MPLPHLWIWFVAALLVALPTWGAGVPAPVDLYALVHRHLPGSQWRESPAGPPVSLIGATGDVLELATAEKDHPLPTNGMVGYWLSPTMTFLGRQRPKVTTSEEAVGIVQLLHALTRGPTFVGQKSYAARAIAGGWIVQVEHQFSNRPESVMAISPYELLVNESGRVRQFRQRSYAYLGSATVYTNTLVSVYERELKRDGARNFPEALFPALHTAWETEQKTATPSATTATPRKPE